jgi:hypothetical protein
VALCINPGLVRSVRLLRRFDEGRSRPSISPTTLIQRELQPTVLLFKSKSLKQLVLKRSPLMCFYANVVMYTVIVFFIGYAFGVKPKRVKKVQDYCHD